MSAQIKLSHYVMDFLARQNVKHVFMLSGGGAMHLDDSLGRCKGLSYVCNLHEQAVAIAAEAHSRVTNNLSAAVVTTGPGSTNTVTGVDGAWLDSTQVIFVSGQSGPISSAIPASVLWACRKLILSPSSAR
jgi:acetolactate synthase I/II/III large subunit